MNSKSTRKNIFSSFFYNQILLHQIPKIEPETEPKTEPKTEPLPDPPSLPVPRIPKEEPKEPPIPAPKPLPIPPAAPVLPAAANGTAEPYPSPIAIGATAPLYIHL